MSDTEGSSFPYIDSDDEGSSFPYIDSDDDGSSFTDENYHTVLCIDIGILHLGFVGILYNADYTFNKIIGVDLIDITTHVHPENMNPADCGLHHTKTFADWMEHVFMTYDSVFSGVDKIIIERQPPQGLVVIEQLIFYKFRDRCEIVSPNAMHKYFGIGHLDYDRRKQAVENMVYYYLQDDSEIVKRYQSYKRRHDIADAMCLGLFWLNQQYEKYKYQADMLRIKNMKISGMDMTVSERLDTFRSTMPCYRRYIPL